VSGYQADVVEVNFAALQAGSQSLNQHASQLTQHVDDLINALAPMKQTWVASGSSAGEAAQSAENKLISATNDIINTIAQFGGKVSDAHDQQYQMEQQNTASFS
jgi:uncharacterized protein YukE